MLSSAFRQSRVICDRINVAHFVKSIHRLQNRIEFIAANRRSACSNQQTQAISPILTVGIVIIGDEVLRGDVRDANAYFLVKNLRRFGVDVRKVTFVGDDAPDIVGEVRDFAKRFNFVLTCGGIGPTHDDITYEAIAEAFGQRTVLNRELWQLFKLYFDSTLTDDSPLTKFATIPENGEVIIRELIHNSRTSKLCLVRLDNVLILPGVPIITERLLPIIVEQLGLQEMLEISRDLYLAIDEASFTPQLNEAVAKFKDVVKFGSYPNLYGNYYKTRLRLEASCVGDLDAVEQFLRQRLPATAIMDDYVSDPLTSAHRRVEMMAEKYSFVREAYFVVCEALRRYKPTEICVAFSGGKDCTVIAYLYHAALQEYATQTCTQPRQNWLYVRLDNNNSRPEVDKFIEDSVALYGAQLITVNASHKEALKLAVAAGMKLFLLGNRAVDPKGDTLEHFKETDPGWPAAMRAFPILKWDYVEVWKFLRELYVPYCSLYDMGFSSLGRKSTPNPKLAYVDERGITRYRPAYLLDDKSTERIGRS